MTLEDTENTDLNDLPLTLQSYEDEKELYLVDYKNPKKDTCYDFYNHDDFAVDDNITKLKGMKKGKGFIAKIFQAGIDKAQGSDNLSSNRKKSQSFVAKIFQSGVDKAQGKNDRSTHRFYGGKPRRSLLRRRAVERGDDVKCLVM
jgi:hypothetical protein